MISREELNRIAQLTGLALYQQEKDYLLKLFLYQYYKRFKDAVFKGGTCIKYLYTLERFSEDIDFTVKRPKQFCKQIQRILRDIEGIGIPNSFIKEEAFPEAYTCEIAFQGPLHRGTAQTRNKFRIDAGKRIGIVKKPEWRLIQSEYPETGQNFLVLAMAPEEILVEKVMAMAERRKGRDLYDVWFMLSAGIRFDRKLLKKKGGTLNLKNLPDKRPYERDLKRLTPRIIAYEQVKSDVERMLGG